jgi:hypothetical protein
MKDNRQGIRLAFFHSSNTGPLPHGAVASTKALRILTPIKSSISITLTDKYLIPATKFKCAFPYLAVAWLNEARAVSVSTLTDNYQIRLPSLSVYFLTLQAHGCMRLEQYQYQLSLISTGIWYRIPCLSVRYFLTLQAHVWMRLEQCQYHTQWQVPVSDTGYTKFKCQVQVYFLT